MIKLQRYIPTNSIIHQLKPQIKLLLFGFNICIMLLVQSLPAIFIASIGIGLFLYQSRVPWSNYISVVRRIKWLFLFLFVINLLFLKQGLLIFEIGTLQIYSGAFQQSLKVGFQLIYMMLAAALLLYTTTPLQLMVGIEWILQPLKKIGLKTERAMLVLFIIFRFVPILVVDFEQLQFAQASRGAHVYEGTLKQRLQAFPALIVPLFETTLFHAHQTAKMLIARRYDEFTNFQPLQVFSSKLKQNYLIIQSLLIILAVIWFNYQGILV